jgi:hypothetical protein
MIEMLEKRTRVDFYLDEKNILYCTDGKTDWRVSVFSGSHDYVDIWLRTDKQIEEANKRIEAIEKKENELYAKRRYEDTGMISRIKKLLKKE